MLSPVTVHGDPLQDWLPPAQITEYPMMAWPLGFGAVQVTVAWPLPGVAETLAGAPGTPVTVTALEGADSGPFPKEFVAVTVNAYDTPLVSPVTVTGDPALERQQPYGGQLMVYPVIALPLALGAVQLTVAWPSPGVLVTLIGASGTGIGVQEPANAASGPTPTALIAATLKV